MGTPWTDVTFPFGSILTSAKQTNLFNNFTAFAEQSSGSPIMYPGQNLISGFNMHHVDAVGSAGIAEAIKVSEGWCIDKSRSQGMYLDVDITKQVMSGTNYSFGDSGGAVPSSLSAVWPVVGSADSWTWYHIFLMKNTSTGSMDWGIDSDIDSANNLMIEVNSVNGGGFDAFRRIGNVFIYDNDNIESFVKYDNFVHRNLGGGRISSCTLVNTWYDLPKIGPSGLHTIVNVTCPNSRDLQDYIYVAPKGVSPTFSGEFGRLGAFCVTMNKMPATTFANSGCMEARCENVAVNASFIWNWYIDFLDGVR